MATDLGKRFRLGAEFVALFILLPTLLAIGRAPVLLVIAVAAIGCGLKLAADGGMKRDDWFRIRAPGSEWRRVLVIYCFAVAALTALLWFASPDALFAFPRRNTPFWILVMIFYPLVSVYPQEIIFRAFIFHRYKMLFGNGWRMIAASAAVFGFAHVLLHNWVAVALTIPGGVLFGITYRRTGALLFVALEHALYGCAVFTIGYGRYLVEGTMRLAHQLQ